MSGLLPSLVMVTSPMSSTIILSRPCGPREERTMLATERAARTKWFEGYRCPSGRLCLILAGLRYLLLLTFDYNLKIFKIAYPFGVFSDRQSGNRLGDLELGYGVKGDSFGMEFGRHSGNFSVLSLIF